MTYAMFPLKNFAKKIYKPSLLKLAVSTAGIKIYNNKKKLSPIENFFLGNYYCELLSCPLYYQFDNQKVTLSVKL